MMWPTQYETDYPTQSFIVPEPTDVPFRKPVPVEVTHYSSPFRMFLKYNFANDHTERLVSSAGHLYSVHIGMFCVVLCDTSETLHRAQVTDIHFDSNGLQVAAEVFYVDRGDVDIVGLDAVLPIDDHIASRPALTVPCCLRRVRPTMQSSRQDLHELTVNSTALYEAVFHGVSEAGVYDVDLFMVGLCVGKSTERRNVADALVERGFATFLLYPFKNIQSHNIPEQPSEQAISVSQNAEQVIAPSSSRVQPVRGVVLHLPPPVIPGVDLVEVTVTHIVTPEHWYAQLAASEMQMKSIKSLLSPPRISEAWNPQELQQGAFCVYKETPSSVGLRAKIEDITPDPETDGEQNVQLSLIDSGEEICTKSSCLYALDAELLEYPPLALRFQLHNIRPWGVWTEAAAFKFKHLLRMNGTVSPPISARVVSVQPGKLITVDLIDEAVGNIGEILVQEGYARKPLKNEASVEKLGHVLFRTDDPMKQDYESFLNSYKIDTDDPSVATTQYAAQNEVGICKFYSRTGYCRYDDRCSYRHVEGYAGNAAMVLDTQPIPSIDVIQTPRIGTAVLGQISAFASPSHFFLLFPYGTKDVSKLPSKHSEKKGTLSCLLSEMQSEYSRRAFDDPLTSRACGEIVAAFSRNQQQWQRARVISANHNVIRVTYPDFGDTEWVPANLVRSLKPQFLHLPFQALQACMSDVRPKQNKHGASWDQECLSAITSWTSGKVLLVNVTDHVEDMLHVKLYMHNDSGVESLGAKLGEAGLAEFHHEMPTAVLNGYV